MTQAELDELQARVTRQVILARAMGDLGIVWDRRRAMVGMVEQQRAVQQSLQRWWEKALTRRP